MLCLLFLFSLHCYAGVILLWRCTAISDFFINEQIRDREVRLIGEDGAQMGVMSIKEAMRLAREADLDLVKIAPNAKPPVRLLITVSSVMNRCVGKRKLKRSRR